MCKTAKFLLIDPQRAFIGNGYWSRHFPPGDTAPIEAACAAIEKLLRDHILPLGSQQPPPLSPRTFSWVRDGWDQKQSVRPPGLIPGPKVQPRIPFACTRCYVRGTDAYWAVPSLSEEATPWFYKPDTDCSRSPGMQEFLADCSCLYIGGCTTTSCVRDSSQAIRRSYPHVPRVVVVLALCGARAENYVPNCDQKPWLCEQYGADFCRGKSAVDLAIAQMQRNGVQVVQEYPERQ